jgi:hypothetical protein
VVRLQRNRGHEFGPHIRDAVGLFGAIEIRHDEGPVMLDTEYEVTGEVVAAAAHGYFRPVREPGLPRAQSQPARVGH